MWEGEISWEAVARSQPSHPQILFRDIFASAEPCQNMAQDHSVAVSESGYFALLSGRTFSSLSKGRKKVGSKGLTVAMLKES